MTSVSRAVKLCGIPKVYAKATIDVAYDYFLGARLGSLEATSFMPGRPKRRADAGLHESLPRGPAGYTLTEKPREPKRRIV